MKGFNLYPELNINSNKIRVFSFCFKNKLGNNSELISVLIWKNKRYFDNNVLNYYNKSSVNILVLKGYILLLFITCNMLLFFAFFGLTLCFLQDSVDPLPSKDHLSLFLGWWIIAISFAFFFQWNRVSVVNKIKIWTIYIFKIFFIYFT